MLRKLFGRQALLPYLLNPGSNRATMGFATPPHLRSGAIPPNGPMPARRRNSLFPFQRWAYSEKSYASRRLAAPLFASPQAESPRPRYWTVSPSPRRLEKVRGWNAAAARTRHAHARDGPRWAPRLQS